MPLKDDDISKCQERYLREYDRYVKMADVTYQKCLDIVQNKLAVRATVQRRAKDPHSFAEKLRKNKDKYESVDQVFEKISDLAAVRITTYLESDRPRVVEEIEKEFLGMSGGKPEVKNEDKSGNGKHYRATHCQVYLPSKYLNGLNKNLEGTTCEIQVCSLLAHVFNEIEHDLQYKPLSGTLSDAERQLIDQLGLITKAGDITIRRLLEATDARLKEATGDFSDVFDFVVRMRDAVGVKGFSENAFQLLAELQDLKLNTPESIYKMLDVDAAELSEFANSEYQKFKKYLSDNPDSTREELVDESSDVLWVAILSSAVDDVVKNNLAIKGRPPRLIALARVYKQMVSEMAEAKVSGTETAIMSDPQPAATH